MHVCVYVHVKGFPYHRLIMATRTFLVVFFTLIFQGRSVDLRNTFVSTYADMLQDNLASTQLQQQINASTATVLQNIATYDVYMANITDQILAEYQDDIGSKVRQFKATLTTTKNRSIDSAVNTRFNPVINCLIEDAQLDVLVEVVNEQIKRCATVAMAEMVNVISNSLAEAQTFMSIPQVIGRDIQRCGLSYKCRWDIVGDAISEGLQVPPKVFALTAKIQSIALKTVVSIDSCGLQGLRQIANTGVSILGDIFSCINNEINTVALNLTTT